MLAAYGIDVLDPKVTPRRLAVLIERLPPWARHGGHQWSSESELLALLIDHVAMLTWVTARAAGSKAKRPQPIPRPDRTVRRDVPSDNARRAGPAGWDEAARQLAVIPGVLVEHDGSADG
jgi:hypothetical protein